MERQNRGRVTLSVRENMKGGERRSDKRHEQKRLLLKDVDAGDSVEILLIAAILTVLGLRGFLALTGYPTFSPSGFHIAHMLWGGILMLVAAILLLNYWNPSMRRLAAAITGVGFGAFIDELGKFITHDHDYFYEPAIALIYVIFILLFLFLRSVRRRRGLSHEEEVLNREIKEYSHETEHRYDRLSVGYFKIRDWIDNGYRRIIGHSLFRVLLIIGFVALATGEMIQIGVAIATRSPFQEVGVTAIQTVSSLISALLILIGIVRLRYYRLDAYKWFRRSVLVSILITQVFVFYDSQLSGLGGLLVYIIIYAGLRYAISREEEKISTA